jgi:hypothetical protein
MWRIISTAICFVLILFPPPGVCADDSTLKLVDGVKLKQRLTERDFFVFDIEVPREPAASFRLQMKVMEPQAGRSVRIRILGTQGIQPFVSRFEGQWADVGKGAVSGFVYSPRIVYAGTHLRLVVQRDSTEAKPYAIPSGFLVQLPTKAPSSTTQFFEPVSRGVPANSVVRLTIAPYKGNPNAKGFCSGSLIGDGSVLITSAHCLEKLPAAANPCEFIKLEAGATSDRDGEELQCERKLISSGELDYALLVVSPRLRDAPPIAVGAVSKQDVVSVLGYPRGMPLMSSGCRGLESPVVPSFDPTKIRGICRNSCVGGDFNGRLAALSQQGSLPAIHRHMCLTRGASSGGPVLQAGKLVALHKGSDLRLGGDPDVDVCAGCLNEQLKLGNWAVSACRILDDAFSRTNSSELATLGVKKCVQ